MSLHFINGNLSFETVAIPDTLSQGKIRGVCFKIAHVDGTNAVCMLFFHFLTYLINEDKQDKLIILACRYVETWVCLPSLRRDGPRSCTQGILGYFRDSQKVASCFSLGVEPEELMKEGPETTVIRRTHNLTSKGATERWSFLAREPVLHTCVNPN